jgi:hypothetical protein
MYFQQSLKFLKNWNSVKNTTSDLPQQRGLAAARSRLELMGREIESHLGTWWNLFNIHRKNTRVFLSWQNLTNWGANPTIVIKNVCAVKIYNSTNSLERFKKTQIYHTLKKRSSLLQCWRCSLTFWSRSIGFRHLLCSYICGKSGK